ncbi:MAG: PQQ-binding-like beta-propeller repeat protein [Thermoplasmatota archaeon]
MKNRIILAMAVFAFLLPVNMISFDTSSVDLPAQTMTGPLMLPPSSSEFPMFRGDPQNTGNVSAAGPTDPKPKWTINNGGYCSPVIKYDQVYFLSTRNAYCFDMDGNIVWSFYTGDIHWNTPLVSGGRIYVAGDSGKLLCLDANATGVGTTTRYWTFTPSDTVDGCTSSPTTDGKRIFYNIETSGNGMIAVWIANGTEAWSSSLDGSLDIESSPAYWNGRVYTGAGNSYKLGNDYLYCFNGINGDLFWKYEAANVICATPSVEYGRVYFGCTDSKVYCVDAIGSGSSTTLYWTHTLTATSSGIDSSPAVAYGKVFIGDTARNSYLYSLDAIGSGGSTTQYWKVSCTPTGLYGICSSPVVTEDFVYVGTTGNAFHCRNITDGSLKWSREYPNGTYGISSSPAVIDDMVVFASDDGYLRMIEQKTDFELPRIESCYPGDGSVDIPLDINVTVVFNEDVLPSSLSKSTVKMKEEGGPVLNTTLGYSSALRSLVIKPTSLLEKDKKYMVTLYPGITDPSENPLDGNGNGMNDGLSDSFSFSFSTIGYARPIISLSTIRALEDHRKTVDLSDFITDADTPFSELDITENSTYAEIEFGDLILNYPQGVTYDLINLTVSDGNNVVHQEIVVTVEAENDPPTIDPLSMINPIEDEDFILDLSDKVHDQDGDVLTVTTSSEYASVNKLLVTFNYPDGIEDEDVVVSVTDGIEGVWTTLKVSVIPVNDPPVINDVNGIPPPYVDLKVAEDALHRIKINYTDIDGPMSDIELDDEPIRMELDYSSSSLLYSPIQEDVGLHIMNFTVKDGDDGRLRDTVQINITVINVNDPPVPSAISLEAGGDENLTVHLKTRPASDEDGDTLRYVWDFGDNHTQIGGLDVFHTYQKAGNYTVRLTVKDAHLSGETTLKIRVTAPIEIPDDDPPDDDPPDDNDTEDPEDNSTIEDDQQEDDDDLLPVYLGIFLAAILLVVIAGFAVFLYMKREKGYEKGEDLGVDLSEMGEVWEDDP